MSEHTISTILTEERRYPPPPDFAALAVAQARLDTLDAAGRQVVRAASVFGNAFWRSGIVELLAPYVEVGVRRIVLDNLLPLGIPEELEGANRATRAAIRAGRLTYRNAG